MKGIRNSWRIKSTELGSWGTCLQNPQIRFHPEPDFQSLSNPRNLVKIDEFDLQNCYKYGRRVRGWSFFFEIFSIIALIWRFFSRFVLRWRRRFRAISSNPDRFPSSDKSHRRRLEIAYPVMSTKSRYVVNLLFCVSSV